ncbi:hypothetical protein [Paraburkholderia sp. RL17-337-BIB-A]|uniref:hypothetical protein n=1 Tax=Paraburkholderia sp. RL17-337-BIB-A TaxID=3031636 RepID=UPI0038B7DC22
MSAPFKGGFGGGNDFIDVTEGNVIAYRNGELGMARDDDAYWAHVKETGQDLKHVSRPWSRVEALKMTCAFLSQNNVSRPLQRFSLRGACFFRRMNRHGERVGEP